MPNRIMREGFLDAEAISRAGELAEVLFTRLILVADDYGRFDGRLTVICRRCWPNGGPDEESVKERLVALAKHGLIVRYEVDGKPYLFLPNFKQRSRAMKSKFPPPSPADSMLQGMTCPQEPVEKPLISEAKLPTAEKTPVEENPSLNNTLQNDSQMSDKRPSGDIHPRTYSDSVSYSDSLKGARGNSTSTPKASAHSFAKAQAAIAESKAALETRAPPPESIQRFIPKRPKGDPPA